MSIRQTAINDKYPTGVTSRPSGDAFIDRQTPKDATEVEGNTEEPVTYDIFSQSRRIAKGRPPHITAEPQQVDV